MALTAKRTGLVTGIVLCVLFVLLAGVMTVVFTLPEAEVAMAEEIPSSPAPEVGH